MEIQEVGYVSDGKLDINMSSTWSFLIREVGRLVDNYNSDLLINIRSIEKDFNDEFFLKCDTADTAYLFGLRKNGVDHTGYVNYEIEMGNRGKYRAIYKLEFHKEGNIVTTKLTEEL